MSDDNFFLDRGDQAWLRRILDSIPPLVEELSITLTRQARVQRGQLGKPHRRKRDGSLPLHLGAAEASAKLQNCLATWVRLVCEQRVVDYGGPDDISSLARWLRAHITDLALTEGAEKSAADVAAHVDQCRRMIDLPPDDEVVIDAHRVEIANRQALTAGQIERVAHKLGDLGKGLTKRRVETLAKRDRIKVAGIDGETKFYRLGDVLAAHQRHARNPGTPRSQA